MYHRGSLVLMFLQSQISSFQGRFPYSIWVFYTGQPGAQPDYTQAWAEYYRQQGYYYPYPQQPGQPQQPGVPPQQPQGPPGGQPGGQQGGPPGGPPGVQQGQ